LKAAKVTQIKHFLSKSHFYYFILNIAVLLILVITLDLDLNRANVEYPFVYQGDMLQVYMYIKMILTGDFPFYTYASSEYLSLPFGFNGADFPFPAASNVLFIKLLSLLSDNLFIVSNLYILLSYFMVANAMFFVLRRLRIDSYLAIAISLLYILIPFHYFRIGHFWFVNYFFLPLTIYYLLLLWRSKPLFFIKKLNVKGYRLDLSRKNLLILSILILFSVWNFYYTFFFLIFIFAVTISAFYYRQSRYHLFSGLIMMLIVIAPLLINLAPYSIYQTENGKNTMVAMRDARESEKYGLKIVQMLLPVDGHNNAKMSQIKEDYSRAPLINENRYATLGLFGSIGFIIMTLFILFHERYFSTIKKLSIISYAGVMTATIGGYSSLFALLITPQIRGYNRISIYIATLALMAFALLLNQAMKRYRFGNILKLIIALIMLRVGIYDQAPAYMSFKHYQNYVQTFQSDKDFIHIIEKQVADQKDKKIFQLPYMSYPEHPSIYNMSDYAPLIGFLHSEDIKWSYGAVAGRESDRWIRRVLRKPLKEQIEILKSSGFNGIYIDRRGYQDRAKSLEKELVDILHIKPIVSSDGNKSFFKMKPTGNKTYDLNYPLEFTVGFYGWEQGFGSIGWTSGDSRLQYINTSDKDELLTLSFEIGTLKKRNISIFYKNQKITSIDLDEGKSREVQLSITAKSGKNILLFKTDTKAYLAGNGDGRSFAFSIKNLKLKIGI
jgi:phosphoglycerol transferase